MDRLPSEPKSIELEQTLKVAKSFRGVLVYFGMQYLIILGIAAMGVVAEVAPGSAPLLGLVILGGIAGAFFCLAMLLVSIYKCSSAMGSVGILWVLGIFSPCLNLIVLLAFNSKAKTFLEQRGVKVGFAGPGPDEIMRLERAVGRGH